MLHVKAKSLVMFSFDNRNLNFPLRGTGKFTYYLFYSMSSSVTVCGSLAWEVLSTLDCKLEKFVHKIKSGFQPC